jgi:hypothetical protein
MLISYPGLTGNGDKLCGHGLRLYVYGYAPFLNTFSQPELIAFSNPIICTLVPRN